MKITSFIFRKTSLCTKTSHKAQNSGFLKHNFPGFWNLDSLTFWYANTFVAKNISPHDTFSHMNFPQIGSRACFLKHHLSCDGEKFYFVVVVLLKAGAAIHRWWRLWWWEDVHQVSDNLLVKTKRILVKGVMLRGFYVVVFGQFYAKFIA